MIIDNNPDSAYNDWAAAKLIGANAAIDAATILVLGLMFTGEDLPAAVLICWLGGAAVGAVVFVAVRYGSLLRCRELRTTTFARHHLLNRDFLYLVASRFDWPLFVASAALLGPMSASVIIGMQPILFSVLLERFTRTLGEGGSGRYNQIAGMQVTLMLGAFAGLALVILGQRTDADALWHGWGNTVLGVLLGASCAVCGALSASRFPLGARMWGTLSSGRDEPLSTRPHPELSTAILASAIANLVAAIALAGVLVGVSEVVLSSVDAASGLLVGAVCMTAGMVTRTAGCLRTQNVDLNAIHYVTPLLSIGLLLAAGLSDGVNTVLVIAGGLCIVASNCALAWFRHRGVNKPLQHVDTVQP